MGQFGGCCVENSNYVEVCGEVVESKVSIFSILECEEGKSLRGT